MFDEKEQKIDIKLEKSDVKQLFKEPPESKGSKIAKGVLKWSGLLILIIIIGFGVVNGPALYSNAKYYTYVNLFNKPYPSKVANLSVSADQIKVEKNNHLIIPKIGVDNTIQYNIDQSQLKNKLKNGLVHLKGSSLPSEKSGNVFIIGHSSFYMWIGNSAASVFSLLHDLKMNDKILLTYNNNNYIYQVKKVETLKSGDIEVNKPSDKKLLTLMTYSPIGTYLNKLIITAEQISSTTPSTPTEDESDTKEKLTETESGTEPTPRLTPTSSPTTSPLPANTDLKFLPDMN